MSHCWDLISRTWQQKIGFSLLYSLTPFCLLLYLPLIFFRLGSFWIRINGSKSQSILYFDSFFLFLYCAHNWTLWVSRCNLSVLLRTFSFTVFSLFSVTSHGDIPYSPIPILHPRKMHIWTTKKPPLPPMYVLPKLQCTTVSFTSVRHPSGPWSL